MSSVLLRPFAVALCAALLFAAAPARAQDDETLGFERTPPRLSFTDGEVSFLRPGADDWTPALVNTALAAGDELYTGQSASCVGGSEATTTRQVTRAKTEVGEKDVDATIATLRVPPA